MASDVQHIITSREGVPIHLCDGYPTYPLGMHEAPPEDHCKKCYAKWNVTGGNYKPEEARVYEQEELTWASNPDIQRAMVEAHEFRRQEVAKTLARQFRDNMRELTKHGLSDEDAAQRILDTISSYTHKYAPATSTPTLEAYEDVQPVERVQPRGGNGGLPRSVRPRIRN